MKKSLLLGAVASLFLGTAINAQVTSPTNVSTPPPQFVGFNGVGVPEELQIRNDFNLPISFHTNGIQRILVDNGGGGFAAGRVAMGNNLPNNFAARDRLHLHQNVRGPLIMVYE